MQFFSPGTLFAGHRIDAVVGQGGTATVYRATHLGLDRAVALKVISPNLAVDESFRERFKLESRVAASLHHPHIVTIHDAGEHEGLLFITMELVESDLAQLLRAETKLPFSEAAEVISQIGSALDAAHDQGLVHRDVKPANILLAEGKERRALLSDFGLTRKLTSAGGLTNTGQWVGTLDYVSPEQVKGQEVSSRADIYSLGCVFFEIVTGDVPFPADNDVAKMWSQVNESPPRLENYSPNFDRALGDVVSRALSKDPEERFPTCFEFAAAVREAGPNRDGGDARGTDDASVDRMAEREADDPGTRPTVSSAPRPNEQVRDQLSESAGEGGDEEGNQEDQPGRASGLPDTSGKPESIQPRAQLPPLKPKPAQARPKLPPLKPKPAQARPKLPPLKPKLAQPSSEEAPPEPELAQPSSEESPSEPEPARPPAEPTTEPPEPTPEEPEAQPGEDQPRRPDRRLRIGLVLAGCIALVSLLVLGGSLVFGGGPSGGTASSGSVSVEYGEDWRSVPSSSSFPGLEFRPSPATLRQKEGLARVEVGRVANARRAPSPLPVAFQDRSSRGFSRSLVEIGGNEWFRYEEKIDPKNNRDAYLTVLLVASSKGYQGFACEGPVAPPGDRSDRVITLVRDACTEIASTLQLTGAEAVAPGPGKKQGLLLSQVLASLRKAERRSVGQLSSDDLGRRASAARRLSRAFRTGARRLQAANVNPQDGESRRAMVTALRSMAQSYADLARGARAEDANSYNAARASIIDSRKKFLQAKESLKRAGYRFAD